jgi:uncharacterized protein involved in exopolysaccharide biosynthesis
MNATDTYNPWACRTVEQLRQTLDDFRNHLKSEERNSGGNHLRAEVARANIREFKRQIAAIEAELKTR